MSGVRRVIGLMTAVSALAYSSLSLADFTLNLTPGATPISRDLYDLHMTVFWVCVAIGVVVFGAMFIALVKFRKSKGAVAANFHANTKLEFFWALIPLLILIALAIPATRVLIDMYDTKDSALSVKVTGYQWKWHYDYMGQNLAFFSNLSTPQDQIQNKAPKDPWYLLEVDNPLVVPIHQKIRFLITANDVIHSWWVPALGIKRDAVPGYIYEAWARIDKPGIYRGQCAELCGIGHGFMPIVVEAKTQEDYAQWLLVQTQGKEAAAAAAEAAASKEWTKDELMKAGETAYGSHCAICHRPDGSGMPPAFPALKGNSVATGPVAKHLDVVLHGVPGTAMQAFGPQLNDADIAAIISYERNAWGNVGDIVQPKEVAAARAQK